MPVIMLDTVMPNRADTASWFELQPLQLRCSCQHTLHGSADCASVDAKLILRRVGPKTNVRESDGEKFYALHCTQQMSVISPLADPAPFAARVDM